MGKTLYELQQERVNAQARALTEIFNSVAASATVELELSEREALMLSKVQQGAAWARLRQEAVVEERDKAREAYFAAEEAYAKAQETRVEEIHRTVFAATRDLNLDQLRQLATAGEEDLDQMLTLALQGSNDQGARAVLHAAWNRGFEQILIRWAEETENGEAELEMLHELNDVEEGEVLQRKADPDSFERVAPGVPTLEALQPRPDTPLLLG